MDDYSRFTWVKFLRSKDETPMFIIKFLKMIQVRLNVLVLRIRTDNETEFVNQTLWDYYEEVGISHETSVARSPHQNGVVETCNHTLVEAACTMLIYSQAPLFLWAEAVETACFTQNRSIIHLRHGKTPYELMHGSVVSMGRGCINRIFTQNRSIIRLRYGKTPYELMHGKQPDLSYFHVFGALCYPTNDGENVRKLQPNADIGIFIGYAPIKKAFRIYNRRTRRIMQKPSSSTSYVPPSRNDWDLLFQPLFDELLNPPPSVDNQDAEVIASIAKAMQEELNEFERLEVWELIPRPDKVMVITLKWIYKVKLDELGGILKNKARLVSRGYRQEEGIFFEESFAPVA
nr:retrovirus-related Pol polyprotein from transposon TNT 1-94 [Tanacetum cinerariifolium]